MVSKHNTTNRKKHTMSSSTRYQVRNLHSSESTLQASQERMEAVTERLAQYDGYIFNLALRHAQINRYWLSGDLTEDTKDIIQETRMLILASPSVSLPSLGTGYLKKVVQTAARNLRLDGQRQQKAEEAAMAATAPLEGHAEAEARVHALLVECGLEEHLEELLHLAMDTPTRKKLGRRAAAQNKKLLAILTGQEAGA